MQAHREGQMTIALAEQPPPEETAPPQGPIEAAIRATDGGCATHIIDARVPHALLLELLTERGVGTMLTRSYPA